MKISIIIPAYNEEETLPSLLKSIKTQNFKDYEIIIADANSTDKTREDYLQKVGIMVQNMQVEIFYYF